MIRTYKYPLHPNKREVNTLNVWFRYCCYLYNAALEQRQIYFQHGKKITLYDQQVQLTQLCQSDPAWRAIPVWVLRSALDRLDKAFKAFFRRCKNGEKPGYPRFKSRYRYSSFSICTATLDRNRVKIPRLGPVKLNLYRPCSGEIKDVHIRRAPSGKWWVSFACNVGEAPVKISTAPKTKIGIDLGLTCLAMRSNGKGIPNPRFYRESQEKLKATQQSLSTKTNGSRSREKARIFVARINERIHNQRLDHARKLAVELYNQYDFIGYENLNVKGMVQHPTLAKSIHDASWSMIVHCLTFKAEKAGKWAVGVDPRGTSQKCSACNTIVKKALSERVHNCPRCGLVLDRDHNAAINILNLAWLQAGFA
jgi:putative transposase